MTKLQFKSVSLIGIAVLFLTLYPSADLFSQESDYQIVERYNREYQELLFEVNGLSDIDSVEPIEMRINAFETQFSAYRELLDAALYPVTFVERVNHLTTQFELRTVSLREVEQLESRVEELETEVDLFQQRINRINSEILALQRTIEQAAASESRQAALIREYRQSLESRDLFVSEFLEELMNRYRRADSASLSELSDRTERFPNQPVEMLKSILSEYIELSNRRTGLSLPDYVSMRAQHGYFSDVWNLIGDRLVRTFDAGRSQQVSVEIDNMLAAWLASVDRNVWTLLRQEFQNQSIALSSFTSSAEFSRSLHEYIDAAYEASLESNREEDYAKYRNFSDFWNSTFKASWGDLVINGRIMTHAEIAAVDVKLSRWGEAAAPISNLMFILLIVSIAVIVGLVVLLVTRKS